MKPINLVMTAFGPYKDEETIDFGELQAQRLFVISGNTGAGKTTIFDAICFAVYGQASGGDRSEVRMLRSHFAEDDVHTSVRFRFELKGTVYEVFRQLPHVKAGNKTETGDRHELYCIMNGESEPITDRQIKSAVDARLEQLIGLSREQFSQIVMLPQGEFRKLLTSDTENKENILRNIFKTNRFKSVETELDNRRKLAKQQLGERMEVRGVHIGSLQSLLQEREDSKLQEVFAQEHYNVHQVMQGLEEEIRECSEETRQQQQLLEQENRLLKQQTSQYHEAKALNERFAELDSLAVKLQQLQLQIPAFDEKKQRLEAANQAKQLQVYERHYTDFLNESKELQSKQQKAQEEEQQAEQAFKQADAHYKQEEQNADARDRLIGELERLQGFQPAVKAIDQTKQQITEWQEALNRLTKSSQQSEKDWTAAQQDKQRLAAEIKELETQLRTYPQKTEQLSAMREQVKLLSEYIKLQTEFGEVQTEEVQQRKLHEQAEQTYAALYERWMSGQASVIAMHLHDGQPCPVCGSAEHPHKAGQSEHIPGKEELDASGKLKEARANSYLTVKTKREQLQKQRTAAADQLSEADLDPQRAQEIYHDMVARGKQLAQQVEQLKAGQEKLDQLRTKAESLESRLEALTQKKDEEKLKLHEKQSELEKERALLEQSVRSIPEELRSMEALSRVLQAAELRKKQMEEAWKKAQADYQSANERLLQSRQHLKYVQQQETDTLVKLNKAKQQLTQALTEAGFDDLDAYQRAKRTEEERRTWAQQIEEFQSSLQLVRKQQEQAKQYLKDKERPQLEALEQQLQERDQQVDTARKLLIQMQSATEKLLDVKDEIVQAEERVQAAESTHHRIKDLYDTIRGENPMKISFERYLQMEFLDSIIESANQRLQQMLNGQYILVRSDRLEKNRRQSGLSFDVFDQYTGQYRDVKTLSGGEKFNASLCLALGMADVIQSYEGGVSIETMFIDEGFGSLDEESLSKAIDALIDLQQHGRMVGVISHVQELKQAIPAILEVTKTKEGCSRTKFVVS